MMFPKMRRIRQQLGKQECINILEHGTHGVLAVSGTCGYPYAVPMSYVYADGKIIFHSALSGHKVESIRRDAKASFCVVAEDEVIASEYTTAYKSVIAFGLLSFLSGDEKRKAANLLALKYNPSASTSSRDEYIDSLFDKMCIFSLSIEHLSGKEGLENLKKRNPQEASPLG